MASTIKVDNVQNQPGTNVVNKCGTTVNIGAASDNIRSAGNNLQASDGGNLISQSGTDITLGASGDTINLASGASQSGFGRTGTVDWQTGDIKTGTFTAADGKGYFINTTSGGVTANLPAGSAGTIVSFADYARTWDTNGVTVSPDGSEKIGGVADDTVLTTEGQSVTFLYQDSTQGWINIQDSTSAVVGGTFIIATGGNSCGTCGSYKWHKFTGPGTFCVSSLSACAANNVVDYLVVAGAGGSGKDNGGGGGAGGFRFYLNTANTAAPGSPALPLNNYPAPGCGTAITVSASPYSIAVGGGGAGGDGYGGVRGAVSTFSSITSTGGGGGTNDGGPYHPCQPGGSGGGAGQSSSGTGCGNTPPTTPPQGNSSGGSPTNPGGGGGGGGALATGTNGAPVNGGPGGVGAGITSAVFGCAGEASGDYSYFSGGGGGGTGQPGSGCGGAGGTGGGGEGGDNAATGCTGTCNTGGGAGGGGQGGGSATGGSGVVVIRYKYK